MTKTEPALKEPHFYAMQKVQDIHRDGTAYHVITTEANNAQSLYRVLICGIIGFYKVPDNRFDRYDPTARSFKKLITEWKHMVRENQMYSSIFFNIIGRRVSDLYTTNPKILTNEPTDICHLSSKLYIIIFDISHLQDNSDSFYNVSQTLRKNCYRPWEFAYDDDYELYRKSNNDADYEDHKNAKGQMVVSTADGFYTYPRIAPRKLRGIVIKNQPDKHGFSDFNLSEQSYNHRYLPFARRTYSIMHRAYKNKPQLFLPIYDVYGNLLWPQRIAYDSLTK